MKSVGILAPLQDKFTEWCTNNVKFLENFPCLSCGLPFNQKMYDIETKCHCPKGTEPVCRCSFSSPISLRSTAFHYRQPHLQPCALLCHLGGLEYILWVTSLLDEPLGQDYSLYSGLFPALSVNACDPSPWMDSRLNQLLHCFRNCRQTDSTTPSAQFLGKSEELFHSTVWGTEQIKDVSLDVSSQGSSVLGGLKTSILKDSPGEMMMILVLWVGISK